MLLASAPVKKHLTQSAVAGSLVNVGASIITDCRSEHRAEFDMALEDWRFKETMSRRSAAVSSPASAAPRSTRQQSSTLSPPPAPAAMQPVRQSSTSAPRLSVKFHAAREKLSAEVAKVGDQSPCFAYFIDGSCKQGSNCRFHHQGRAGAYKIS